MRSPEANPLVENSYRVTAADLSGGDKNLMAREDMLFQEVMKGSIALKVVRQAAMPEYLINGSVHRDVQEVWDATPPSFC